MEKLESKLRWDDVIKILEKRYKKEFNVQNLQLTYSDEEVTKYCDDHDGFPPEKVTYTSRKFTISFTKKAGLISIPCVIKKSCSEISDDLKEELSKLLESSDLELDDLFIWGCYFNFDIEYSFHMKANDKQKILK